jgi:thymidylate synthase ThyX
LNATLVYASGDRSVVIPEIMGKPRDDQMQGSVHDQIIEIAGRACYDSLGVGRDSASYHKNLVDSQHLSTHEHVHWTFLLGADLAEEQVEEYPNTAFWATAFLNRKGCHVEMSPDGLRVTLNFRAIREWFAYPPPLAMIHPRYAESSDQIGAAIQRRIIGEAPLSSVGITPPPTKPMDVELVRPMSDHEQVASVYMECVRAVSHEQVRHRNSGISQRSTRYVNESESEWEAHPLVQLNPEAMKLFHQCEAICRKGYDDIADLLSTDGSLNRKQVRGAARDVLGQALPTQMLVSSDLFGWKWMFHMRLSPFADDAIRLLYSKIWPLLSGAFPSHFVGWKVGKSPSPTGGLVVESVGPEFEPFIKKKTGSNV